MQQESLKEEQLPLCRIKPEIVPKANEISREIRYARNDNAQ
jgi:hypothetical protein